MNLPDIPEIKVEAVRDEVVYSLPPRPIGKARWLGLFLIGFSLLFISMPVKELIQFLSKILSGSGDIGSWAFSLFLIPFVIVGLFPFRLGVLCIWGCCRVEWRKNRLSVLEYAGPIRWRRRMPKAMIQELMVGLDLRNEHKSANETKLPFKVSLLEAVFADGSRKVVLGGYPREWTQAIGQDLAVRIGVKTTGQPSEVKVVIQPEPVIRTVTIERPIEQPLHSAIRMERDAQRLALLVPPLGIWRGSRGLFILGIVVCVFTLIFSGILAFAVKDELPWFEWLVVSVFHLAGISMLIGAINMGRRSALLVATGDELKIAVTGPFGSKRWQWRRAEITEIRVGNSGMAVNDVQIKELQVVPHGKTKVGFLSNRTDDELRWLAFELCQRLQIAYTEREVSDAAEVILSRPAYSHIKVEEVLGRKAWIIPPAGILKGSKGVLFFGIFWCLFMVVLTGLMIGSTLSGKQTITWGAWLFVSLFWLIGLGVIALAVNMGWGHAMIVWDGSELKVALMGPFGAKRWQWACADIAEVKMGDSGMEVNDVPVKELQIIPADGKKVGLFSELDEEELLWLAQQIRLAIRPTKTTG